MDKDAYEQAQDDLKTEFGLNVKKSGEGEPDKDAFTEMKKSLTDLEGDETEAEETEVSKAGEGNDATEETEVSKAGAGEEEEASEETKEPEEETTSTMKSLSAEYDGPDDLETVLKGGLSDGNLQVVDGEDFIGELMKGFTEVAGSTNRQVAEQTVVMKGIMHTQMLMMKGMVQQNAELRQRNDQLLNGLTELVKALENTPMQFAAQGVRAALAPSDAESVRKSYMRETEGGDAIDYDSLASLVRKAISKPDHLKTEGERLLEGKHMVVRNGNYRSLPAKFRSEIGLPTD